MHPLCLASYNVSPTFQYIYTYIYIYIYKRQVNACLLVRDNLYPELRVRFLRYADYPIEGVLSIAGYSSCSTGRLAALAAGRVQFHTDVDFRIIDGNFLPFLPRVCIPDVFNSTHPGAGATILKLVPQIGRK